MSSIKPLVIILSVLVAGSFQASAILTTVNTGGEESLQSVLNRKGNTLVDIQNDAHQLDDSQDSLWTSLGSASASIVVEIAGYAGNNRFGIYNAANPAQRTEIFSGIDNEGVSVAIAPAYSVFGFYLQNTVNGNFIWFSDSSLNANGQGDHMVAYAGMGENLSLGGAAGVQQWDADSYILGWEDLNLGDRDYQDMVVLVKGVRSVPDAGATLVLLGAGVTAVGFLRRRK